MHRYCPGLNFSTHKKQLFNKKKESKKTKNIHTAGPQEAEERKLKENSDTRKDQILKCDS